MKYKTLLLTALLLVAGRAAQAEQIGSVDTVFKMFGPDHKIVVEAFDDPDVKTSPATSAARRRAVLKAAWGWRKTLPMRQSPVSRWDRLS